MSRNLAIVAATAFLALTACGGQKAPPAITEGVPDEVVSQFLSAMDEFNPETVRGLLSPNAKIMPPNVAAISGVDNIIDYYKGALADELDFEFTREASGMSSGLAVAEGGYRIKNKATGAYIEQGKWMAVFAKIDGAWKVARLMTNTDAPTAAPVVGIDEAKTAE
jgi:limonene-1,2-epoxide hydrolase